MGEGPGVARPVVLRRGVGGRIVPSPPLVSSSRVVVGTIEIMMVDIHMQCNGSMSCLGNARAIDATQALWAAHVACIQCGVADCCCWYEQSCALPTLNGGGPCAKCLRHVPYETWQHRVHLSGELRLEAHTDVATLDHPRLGVCVPSVMVWTRGGTRPLYRRSGLSLYPIETNHNVFVIF